MTMKRRRLTQVAAALTTLGASVGIAALAGSTAGASYGAGTQFQVEISAGANSLPSLGGDTNGSGGGFWFWAALTPSSPIAKSGTVDYEETDCVHGVPSVPTGAFHSTHSGTTTYTESGGVLTISGVDTALGLQTITVPDTYGHYGASDVNLGFFSVLPNIQVQVAP